MGSLIDVVKAASGPCGRLARSGGSLNSGEKAGELR